MSLSRFLLCTSLATAGAAGCSDDNCGPRGAPAVGIVASDSGVTMTYGNFSGSPNNDCPDPAAPSGVISLTIVGTQSDGTGLLTLCVGRPDLLASGAPAFGPDPGQIHVIDFNGTANNCTLTIDKTQPPSGVAASSGMCGNGSDAAGFAIQFNAAFIFKRTCGATIDSPLLAVRGLVAVAGPK